MGRGAWETIVHRVAKDSDTATEQQQENVIEMNLYIILNEEGFLK